MTNANRLPAMEERLLTFREACKRLGMAPQTGYNRKKLGTFPVPVRKLGRSNRVLLSDLLAYFDSLADVTAKPRRGRPRSA
jgi:predicted DNA-binding transcriptional regulator AlpA